MTIAHAYAKALFEAVQSGNENASLKNLRAALKRRGHERLLPRIFSEYELLVLKQERSKEHRRVTKENERTRVLLELYRKLIATHA